MRGQASQLSIAPPTRGRSAARVHPAGPNPSGFELPLRASKLTQQECATSSKFLGTAGAATSWKSAPADSFSRDRPRAEASRAKTRPHGSGLRTCVRAITEQRKPLQTRQASHWRILTAVQRLTVCVVRPQQLQNTRNRPSSASIWPCVVDGIRILGLLKTEAWTAEDAESAEGREQRQPTRDQCLTNSLLLLFSQFPSASLRSAVL